MNLLWATLGGSIIGFALGVGVMRACFLRPANWAQPLSNDLADKLELRLKWLAHYDPMVEALFFERRAMKQKLEALAK